MNYNIATISNYKLEIGDVPELNYFIQTTELPNINLQEVPTPYSNNAVYVPGDTIDWDPLNITFLVDEDYTNFKFLHNWIQETKRNRLGAVLRDLTLLIMNNNKNVTTRVAFRYAFPTMLGNVSFDSSENDTIPVICSAIFRYQYYEFV